MINRKVLNEIETRDFLNDLIARDYNSSNIYVTDLELLVGCDGEGAFDTIEISFITYDEDGRFDKDIHIDFSLEHYYISISDHYCNKDISYLYTILGCSDAVYEGIKKICKAYTEELHKKSFDKLLKIFFEEFYSSLKNIYEINLEVREKDDLNEIEKIIIITDKNERVKFKKKIINELHSKELADALCKDDESIDKLSNEFWIDIISKSLLDIHKKYEYAKKLGLKELENECKIVITSLKPDSGEVLYLKEMNSNSDNEIKRIKPFMSIREVISYIEKIDSAKLVNGNNRNETNTNSSYKLEKWLPDYKYREYYYSNKYDSNMELEYVYYIMNDNIVYANKGKKLNEKDDLKFLSIPNNVILS